MVRKGTDGTWLTLTEERWRWLCGNTPNLNAGDIASATSSGVSSQCLKSFEGQDWLAQLCNAAAYAIGPVLQGILGNWERTRCSGATSVQFDYKPSGEIIWHCWR